MKYISFIVLFLSLYASAQTQLEINQQAADSMHMADAERTAVYKQARNTGDATQKKLLLKAQQEWVRYKQAHCKAIAQNYDKGSMQPMILYNCIKELTKERTQKLKRYLEQGGLY